jgi:hypothetical protein
LPGVIAVELHLGKTRVPENKFFFAAEKKEKER